MKAKTKPSASSSPRGFRGRVALITGGASGIGSECVRQLTALGTKVVIADTDEAAGTRLARKLTAAGRQVRYLRTDVTDSRSVAAGVDQTLRWFGRLDFALNNAGVDGARAVTAEYPEPVWNQVLAVNLTGVFLCLKEELKVMGANRSGSIVNLSSVAGLTGFVAHSAYTAAKHGVVGLTRTAALEYAKAGVRINAICPSYTQTPMLERVAQRIPGLKARLSSIAPLGRLCTPGEIARAAVYLFSPDAAFITGQCLVLDGGILAE